MSAMVTNEPQPEISGTEGAVLPMGNEDPQEEPVPLPRAAGGAVARQHSPASSDQEMSPSTVSELPCFASRDRWPADVSPATPEDHSSSLKLKAAVAAAEPTKNGEGDNSGRKAKRKRMPPALHDAALLRPPPSEQGVLINASSAPASPSGSRCITAADFYGGGPTSAGFGGDHDGQETRCKRSNSFSGGSGTPLVTPTAADCFRLGPLDLCHGYQGGLRREASGEMGASKSKHFSASDAESVYRRLWNFAARRKALVERCVSQEDSGEMAEIIDIDPSSPFVHRKVLNHRSVAGLASWSVSPHAPAPPPTPTLSRAPASPQHPEAGLFFMPVVGGNLAAGHLSNSGPRTPSVSPAMQFASVHEGIRRACHSDTDIVAMVAAAATAAASPSDSRPAMGHTSSGGHHQDMTGCTPGSLQNGGSSSSTAQARDEEEEEFQRIELIQRHLEEMNSAAADLNAAQEALAACNKDRLSRVQLWAVLSARLARAVGAQRLAKATPFFDRRRRLEAAKQGVDVAGKRFAAAAEAKPADAAELAHHAAEHARCLREFQAAQQDVAKHGDNLQASTMEAVQPYFEAEDEHRERLLEADELRSRLGSHVEAAKARYHAALRGLETLSEQAHRHRASSGSGAASAAIVDSPVPPINGVDCANMRRGSKRMPSKAATASPLPTTGSQATPRGELPPLPIAGLAEGRRRPPGEATDCKTSIQQSPRRGGAVAAAISECSAEGMVAAAA
eukprot:TRINITY_DN80282_c0_g1_i1.p1 TRINITY_DN80282_c0_g1~~TRINITY_DN80282_c0_g1_i1.p1  ORF type:complete len:735 (+),score=173.09 TRINITY_DN80282_c0_g1_i1:72-2276(+)